MKFSTFHLLPWQPPGTPPADIYAEQFQIIRWLDEMGFDSCWAAEHHFRDYGLVPNTMIFLAHVAGITKRLRLGNAIVIMPFHHPLRAAEDAAMVDVISGGRVEFGFGRGYQGVEFAGFGVSVDDTRDRTDEALDVVLKAWTGEPVTYHGKYYQVDNVAITPPPIQKPHPPLHVASIGPQSIEHYAKKGIPFMVDSTMTNTKVAENIRLWKDVARKSGHDADGADFVVMRNVHLNDSNEKARDFVMSLTQDSPLAATYESQGTPVKEEQQYLYQSAPIDPKTGKLGRGYEYWQRGVAGRTPDEFQMASQDSWENRWVAGDLDRVTRQIEDLEAAGVTNIMLGTSAKLLGNDLRETRKTLERFTREVLEPFSKRAATPGTTP